MVPLRWTSLISSSRRPCRARRPCGLAWFLWCVTFGSSAITLGAFSFKACQQLGVSLTSLRESLPSFTFLAAKPSCVSSLCSHHRSSARRFPRRPPSAYIIRNDKDGIPVIWKQMVCFFWIFITIKNNFSCISLFARRPARCWNIHFNETRREWERKKWLLCLSEAKEGSWARGG